MSARLAPPEMTDEQLPLVEIDSHDPSAAIFSSCRLYRYELWRRWGNGKFLAVIGLNPSTADEQLNDPTIRKCIGYAKRWGFDALCMLNLFAWRDTDPENMKKSEFPEGLHNDHHILKNASAADLVIAAWGKHGSFRNRDIAVMDQLFRIGVKLHYLHRNNDGSPGHPLYLPNSATPTPFQEP